MILDLKRIIHKKIPIVILLLVMSLVVINLNIRQKSDGQDIDSVSDLSRYSFLLLPKLRESKELIEDSSSPSSGEKLIEQLPTTSTYVEAYDIITYHYEMNYEFFSTLQQAFELDGIQLLEHEMDDLQYALQASEFIEVNQLDTEKNFFFSTFLDSVPIYFHNGVIFIISVMIVMLFGESFDIGTYKLDRLLPKSVQRQIFEKYVLACALAIYYMVCLWGVYLIYAALHHFEFKDALFPVRIVGEGISLSAIQLIFKISLTFIIKVIATTSVGLCIVALLKNKESSVIVYAIFSVILVFMTNFVTPLQNNVNPFYTDYPYQFLSVEAFYEGENGTEWHTVSNNFSMVTLGIWMIISILMLFVTSKVLVREIRLFNRNHTNFEGSFFILHTSIGFEFRKITTYFNRLITYSITISLIGTMVAVLMMKDYNVRQQLIFNDGIDSVQLDLEQLISTYEEHLANETDDVKKSAYRFSIQGFQEQLAQVEVRMAYYDKISQAYRLGNSEEFYTNLDYLLKSAFGKFSYEEFVHYHPKENYYNEGFFPTEFGYYVSQERLQLLKESEMPPLLNTQRVLTPYDYPKYASDYLEEILSTQVSELSFVHLCYRLTQAFRLDLVLVMLIVIFCSAGYYLDTSLSRSNRWLNIMPIKQTTIFLQKIGASYLRMLLYIGVVSLFLFVIAMLNGGLGNVDFPILIMKTQLDFHELGADYTNYFEWMAVGVYLFKNLIGLVVASSFVMMVMITVSQFSKSFIKSMGITLIVMVAGYILSLWQSIDSIGKWLPFRYLNFVQVLEGTLYVGNQLSVMSSSMAYLILVVWTVIVYAIGYGMISRQRSKGAIAC